MLTLDEYCNPALSPEDLRSRNLDQVIGRHERYRQKRDHAIQKQARVIDGGDVSVLLEKLWIFLRACVSQLYERKDGKSVHQRPKETVAQKHQLPESAIYVNQTWIWKVGEFAIMTQPSVDSSLSLPGFLSDISDKRIVIAFALKHFVELFDKPSKRAPRPILKIYESELSVISEEVNRYVKSAVVKDIDIDQEKAFIHQIGDLREELSMIKSVLAEQEEV